VALSSLNPAGGGPGERDSSRLVNISHDTQAM